MDDCIHDNCCDTTKRQLNLSHRDLKSFEDAGVATSSHFIEYLDLSHNRINNLNWIYEFPNLKCLIMDNNRLREAHFEKLKKPLNNVHTLMLNKNELSDLETTASFLRRIFPNVQYLSLHGNPMCPDDLLLQPFCAFVPYEYDHYRTVLEKLLPHLKFLDHFSLDLLRLQSAAATAKTQIKQRKDWRPKQYGLQEFVSSTANYLWSKVKSVLLPVPSNDADNNN